MLPDGKLHFIRNERYPTRIARAADGRIMMQYLDDDIPSECDRPTIRIAATMSLLECVCH